MRNSKITNVGTLLVLIALSLTALISCGEQENQVFGVGEVDEPPKFQGTIQSYVQENVEYPQAAKDDSISGIVRVQFVVDDYGQTQQIEVTESLDPACDSAVVRMVRSMPEWEPGTIDDFPVKVLVELPVQFDYDELESGFPEN